jgi:hypothetical protein
MPQTNIKHTCFSCEKDVSETEGEWVQCDECEKMKNIKVGRPVVLKGGAHRWICFLCLPSKKERTKSELET